MSDGSPSVRTMTSLRKLRAWLMTSPAWRSAVPSRVDRPDDSPARRLDAGAVVGLVERLDAGHFDVVASVGGEGEQAEGVAERTHGLGQNGDRESFHIENAGARSEPVARRLRRVQQQQHREVAMS